MKKEWKSLLAVFGIALLAVAVAFMPACDTGESCDLDLETLNGKWEVSRTTSDFGSPTTETVNVAIEVIDENHLIWTEEGDDEISFILGCGGDSFNLSYQDSLSAQGCTLTDSIQARGTLTSVDRFTGTYTISFSCSGGVECCGPFEGSFSINYEIEATRL